jgi:hypothetical protein
MRAGGRSVGDGVTVTQIDIEVEIAHRQAQAATSKQFQSQRHKLARGDCNPIK